MVREHGTERSVARDVVRQSGVYSLGNLVVKAAGLLLAPILLNSRFLSIADYGYLALLLVTAQLCTLTFGLGIASGFLRFYSDPDFEAVRARLPVTALVSSTAVAAVLSVLVYGAFGRSLAAALLDAPAAAPLVGWMLVYVTLKVAGSSALMHLRVTDRPGIYTGLIVCEMAVLIGSAYVLLVELGMGLRGAVLSYVVAAGVSTAAAVLMTVPGMTLRLAPAIVRPLIRFGAPLVVAGLSAWLLNVGDRYMLKWLGEPADVGLYDFGSRVAGIVNLVFVQSFQLAFAVFGLRQFDRGQLGLHQSALRHYSVWTGWFVLLISVFAGDGMKILVGWFGVETFYLGIDRVVFPVAAGFWFYGVYHVAVNVLYGLGRTRLIAGFVMAAAAINLLLNLVLIPPFGVVGAALATTAAFALLALATLTVSERLMAVGFDVAILAVVSLAMVLLWVASEQLSPLAGIPRVGLRLILVGLYLPLVVASRRFGAEDFRRVLGFLGRQARGDEG